jgi:dihydroneopterin aldolase
MLTVSLHSIKLMAPRGLYPQEHILNNTFETDVDLYLPDQRPWPYADYTIIHRVVNHVFSQPDQLLENFVENIHAALKTEFPYCLKIKVAVRKLNPPLTGQVGYAQVCLEQ